MDGQYEKFTQVEKTIKSNLATIVKSAPELNQPTESMLAGSIAMALCYIARLQREKPKGSKLNARILLLTGSLECASQYMTYMNVFFTAQKQNIVLDVCALDEAMTLLQQGCDITGGQYLRLKDAEVKEQGKNQSQIDGLLQYLLVSSKQFNPLLVCKLIRFLFEFSVGIPTGSKYKKQISFTASNKSRLSSRMLLSSRVN